MAQLPLDFPLEPRLTFAEYVSGANVEAVQRCVALTRDTGFAALWLWGGEAVGKTHLAQATVRTMAVSKAVYLPARQLPLDNPACLEGLGRLALVALDDVHALLGQPSFELALLAVYQELLQHGGRLLLTAAGPATAATFQVPDLASRFRAAESYELYPLDEAALRTLVTERADRRGLVLGPKALEFWLRRAPRRPDVLLAQLAELDRAAMAGLRGGVTVPLLKQVLGY